MLRWRLLLSVIMISALIVGLYFDAWWGPAAPILLLLGVVLAIRASWEMVDLLRAGSLRPRLAIVTACSVAIVASNWIPALIGGAKVGSLSPCSMAFVLSLLVMFVHAALSYRQPGESLQNLAAEVLAVSYIGLLLSLTALLRWVGGGYIALGSLIVATKSGDIGAYTLGRLFGKRKLAPRLSPGKTWAGAYGAVLGAAAASCVWFQLVVPYCFPSVQAAAAHWAILYGATIGIVGLLGDLCESLIKRDVGRKDSAELLPGFGGVLDILDSILFAAPVAYLLWLILPLAPL